MPGPSPASGHEAAAKLCSQDSSCPLYTQKQTCAVQRPMSALGQKRTLGEIYPISLSAVNWRRRIGADHHPVGSRQLKL